MQNSPLLVSQVAPVDKVDARPQPKQKKAGESFEQVLSKQVQKEQANAKVDENGQVTERAEDTENIALTGLLAEMPDEQPLGEAAVEASVDAQLLAKAATAKVVKEVTEGEVDIDAGLTANLAASIQPNQATLSTTSQSQVDVLASQKKAGLTVDTKLTVDARLSRFDDAAVTGKTFKRIE